MTLGMTPVYMKELRLIMSWHWNARRLRDAPFFQVYEMVRLAGKLGRIGKACPWIYHLMPHIYASIALT